MSTGVVHDGVQRLGGVFMQGVCVCPVPQDRAFKKIIYLTV